MKILMLSDGQGWVIDRLTDDIINHLPEHQFTKRYYTKIEPDELIRLSRLHDVVHYQNSDVGRLLPALKGVKTPLIISIRSFRYPEVVKELKPTFFHVIQPDLLKEFDNAVFVPDPTGFYGNKYEVKPFTVGMACQPTPYNLEYKGVNLVKEVCDEMGIELALATNVPPAKMIEFYNACNVVVCASVAEGHSTVVMECLAINKPVITTDVGIPKLLNCHKVERTKESIKAMLEKFYTAPQTKPYMWEAVLPQIKEMYERAVNATT